MTTASFEASQRRWGTVEIQSDNPGWLRPTEKLEAKKPHFSTKAYRERRLQSMLFKGGFFFSICLKNRWLHLVLRVIIKKDEENPFDEKQWKCPCSVVRTSRFFFSQVKHEQIEAPGSQPRAHSDCLLVKTFRAGT